MSLRETRNAPFCWQEKGALRQLRAFYSGERLKRRSTALAIYVVLTEIASDQSGQAHAQAFVKTIGEKVGAKETTIKDYLRDFEAIGLIKVERRIVEERLNAANIYHLMTAPAEQGGGSLERPTGSAEPLGTGSPQCPTPTTERPQLEELTLKKDPEETDDQFIRRVSIRYKLTPSTARTLAKMCLDDEGRLRRPAFEEVAYKNR